MSHFIVECLPARVLASQKHTQTHVYSEGGGGRVGPTGGRIKAPQVKSYTTTRHDLFLRLADGREVAVSFPIDSLSVREGHALTLVSVFRAGAGYYARLFNHDTRLLYNVLARHEWRALVVGPPATPLDAAGESQPTAPSGLYRRARAAFQQWKAEFVKGWDAAGGPDREPSQAELTAPRALELERTIVAALQEIGITLL